MAGVGGACHSRRICDRRWVLRRGYDKLGLAALALLFPPPSTHTHTPTLLTSITKAFLRIRLTLPHLSLHSIIQRQAQKVVYYCSLRCEVSSPLTSDQGRHFLAKKCPETNQPLIIDDNPDGILVLDSTHTPTAFKHKVDFNMPELFLSLIKSRHIKSVS